MAITAEELNVIIGANVQGLTKAIDRAERRIERFSKQSQKQMSSTSKAFDNLGKAAKRLGPLIAAGLTVQAVRSISNMGVEIENLARVSGVTVERFQELAFGARRFGVEQEKFADIIKDVNDKVGDYLATGAGPLVDFFENIAPKVGVTAEQFAKLSGPQALQLYVSSLEKAGVSQQQMTFYMEALASDATLLVDLFKNNGAAADEFAQKLRASGGIMDKELIEKSKQANEALDLMGTTIMAQLSQAMVDLLPFITDVAQVIGTIAENIGVAYREVRDFIIGIFGLDIDGLNEKIAYQTKLIAGQKRILEATTQEYLRANEANKSQLAGVIKGQKEQLAGSEERLRQLKEELRLKTEIAKAPNPPATFIPSSLAAVNPSLTTGQDSGKTTQETIEETKNAYEELAESIGASFDSAFERMIDGTLSVKDAFKEMAISIIKDILKIQAQQAGGGSGGLFSTLARGFSAYFSPGALSSRAAASALPASFASGGMSMGTRPFIAGEHGRELVIPTGTSRILSAPQTKDILQQSGQPVTVNQTFNISTGVAQTVRAELVGLMPAIQQQTVAAVANQKSRGGARGSRL